MDEKSKITNGAFNSSFRLQYWTTTLVDYVESDGVEFLGCAKVNQNGSISQGFLGDEEKQTIRFYVKLDEASVPPFGLITIKIKNVNGVTVATRNFTLNSSLGWVEKSFEVGLHLGNFTLHFENTFANPFYLDEVYVGEVFITRQKIAYIVSTRLGEIATTLGYLTEQRDEGNYTLTDGDYTHEITDSMVEMGFTNERGQADVRWIDYEDVPALISKVTDKMIQKATNSLAMFTDVRSGNSTENYSQMVDNIAKLNASNNKVGSQQIRQIPITYR